MVEFWMAIAGLGFGWLCYLAGKIDGFKEGFDKAIFLKTAQREDSK